MIQAALLFALLFPVAAFPRNTQNGSPLRPATPETDPTSNVLSGKIPAPARGTCQDLLYTVPSFAPLSEYLSLIALRVTLEDLGCPAEAHLLQLQLSRTGGKDTETLILGSQKRSLEEGISNSKAILEDLRGFPGERKRVGRSVTLPETCTSEHGWVFYETASLLVEFAEKLPSTDVVREFKASAVNVTQKCTAESWEHLEEIRDRLLKSPEVVNATIPMKDQIYFIARIAVLLKRMFVGLLLNYFQAVSG